jgi:hypothetical protein
VSITVKVKLDQQQLDLLDQLPVYLRKHVAEKALTAMSKPISRMALLLAPDSEKSGSRKKWSRKYKDNPGWRDIHSGRHVGSKFFKGRNKDVVYVGIKWTGTNKGNKQHFNHPFKRSTERVHYLWGKPGQKLIYNRGQPNEYEVTRGPLPKPTVFSRPKSRWFVKIAYENTRAQQLREFVKVVERELKKYRGRGGLIG